MAAGAIPGAVLGIVTRDGARAVRWAGLAQRVPAAEPLDRGTWFDLASLTKVLFTTPVILRLVPELDASLVTAIPDLRQYDTQAAERALSFRQCLTHQTHLPAVEPLYTYGQDPATLRAFILQREWRAGPPVYSDIGFMLLGIAIERLSGKALAGHPLAEGLSFRPDPRHCAATEHCTWRGRILRGEVHDENAAALGGAAGHAGLFGTVDGVLDHALTLLRTPDDPQLQRQTATRALGWEASHQGWAGGPACGPDTVGHTGFTGTGLWLDPGRGMAWALLTNRVHPSRHVATGIQALRRATSEAVMAGVG